MHKPPLSARSRPLALVTLLIIIASAFSWLPAMAEDPAVTPAEGIKTAMINPPYRMMLPRVFHDYDGSAIRIGLLVPLSDPLTSMGQAAVNGAQLAVEEWNNVSLNGRHAVLEKYDSGCNPATATAQFTAMANLGIQYVVGDICSGSSVPMSLIAEERGILMITPTGTNPDITKYPNGVTKQYVFRAAFTDEFMGASAARYAYEKLGAKHAWVMTNTDSTQSKAMTTGFTAKFASLGGSTSPHEYTNATVDYSGVIQPAASSYDVIFVPDSADRVNTIAAKARTDLGITTKFLGGDGWDTTSLNSTVVAPGYYVTQYSSLDPRPIIADWVPRYQNRFGARPDSVATLSYDSTRMILASISLAGVDNPALVKNSLAANTFLVETGPISFDAHHDPIKTAFIMNVKNGTGGSGIGFETIITP